MNLRIRTPFYTFFLNPDYVAARSLRSLRSNKSNYSLIWIGLLEDRRIDNAFNIIFDSLLYKTSRFRVAVRLFSNKSRKTSKCGKNVSDTFGYLLMRHFCFVHTTF